MNKKPLFNLVTDMEKLKLKFKDKHKDIEFIYYKSNRLHSNTYYINLKRQGTVVQFRLSDHHTQLTSEGGGIRTLILTSQVPYKYVLQFLDTGVRKLENKQRIFRVDKLFRQIEKEI